jgi:hypothetical protein
MPQSLNGVKFIESLHDFTVLEGDNRRSIGIDDLMVQTNE